MAGLVSEAEESPSPQGRSLPLLQQWRGELQCVMSLVTYTLHPQVDGASARHRIVVAGEDASVLEVSPQASVCHRFLTPPRKWQATDSYKLINLETRSI
jgi:hypothetical protein